MNKEESKIRAAMGWRGGDADAFLRRLEMAKICPEFPFDGAPEAGISLSAQESGYIRRIFIWATRRFLEQREVMSERASQRVISSCRRVN